MNDDIYEFGFEEAGDTMKILMLIMMMANLRYFSAGNGCQPDGGDRSRGGELFLSFQ